MSNLTLRGNASGSGTFTLESPNSNTSRTLTLPDATTTLVGTDATQTLTNKTIQGGALTLDTVKTATGTAVDFTGIPSWVKRVTVMLSGVSMNGTSYPLLQLGDSDGIETTGYTAYGYISAPAGSAGLSFTNGFPVYDNSRTATSAMHGAFNATLLTGNTWLVTGLFMDQDNTVSSYTTAGSKTLSATLDRIRITTANGTDTFDAGTINILYEG